MNVLRVAKIIPEFLFNLRRMREIKQEFTGNRRRMGACCLSVL
jgi:hypothetical protein